MFNFENFLNAMRGNYKGEMPSMKEMLTGNSAYINQSIPGMNMSNELGVVTAQGQGNFNIMNPFTYGNMKKAVEGTRAGDKNIEYSDTPAGKIGEAANERNRMIQELLGESMIVPNTKSENSFGNFESLLIPRRN